MTGSRTRAQNLVGRRFGRLLVLAPGPAVRFGRMQPGWICLCTCGTFELIAHSRLPTTETKINGKKDGSLRNIIDACSACRNTRLCEVCGAAFYGAKSQTACSQACSEIRLRKRWRAEYYALAAKVPNLSQIRYGAFKLRLEKRDDTSMRMIETQLRARQLRKVRLNTNPELREKMNEIARKIYKEKAAETQAKRRARLDAMNEDDLRRWTERAKRYGRLYRKKWQAELISDPERHEKFKEIMREHRRQCQRQIELLKMTTISNELMRRSKS